MDQIEIAGDPPLTIALRRSGRARRLSLRISQLDGRVTLTLPPGVKDGVARAFAVEKADWVRKHLARQEGAIAVGVGQRIAVEGQPVLIVAGRGLRPEVEGDVLRVPGPEGQIADRVAGFLKRIARDRLTDASEAYAKAIGLPYGKITLRDTRSRWGSCSSAGNLMYSWRLVMAPPAVLRYVAAHEVAHLAQMNHSARFWAEVDRLYPGYDVPRRWLRDHGAGLHRYTFGK